MSRFILQKIVATFLWGIHVFFYMCIDLKHGVGGGGCLKKQMTKWHLGFSTRSSWLPVEVTWQFVLFLLYLTLLIRYCIIKIENIWHQLTFLYLHALPVNFLMTPTVHLSQRSIEEASLSLSSIIPQNISDPSPLDSHLSCSSCHFFYVLCFWTLSIFSSAATCFLNPLFLQWPLSLRFSFSLPVARLPSLLWSCL